MRASGPLVPVSIELPAKAKDIVRQSNQPVPSPIAVTGLIDTGAGSTCVSQKVCQHLNLRPQGAIRMLTAGHPVYVPVYTVHLSIATESGKLVMIDPLTVAAPPLAGQANIDCLIGRNILALAVFVYTGPTNWISLSV